MKKNETSLLVLDFDKTVGASDMVSPRGLTVEIAYEKAIRNALGKDVLQTYLNEGGLKNRAPGEIIKGLTVHYELSFLLTRASVYFKKYQRDLQKFVPKGKGYPLHLEQQPLDFITEILVRAKLYWLHNELGQKFPQGGGQWPLPCPGAVDFLKAVERWNVHCSFNGSNYIAVGIVSSGHDVFIADAFKQWGLRPPTLVVTDDDMRTRELSMVPLSRKVKPARFPLTTLHARWYESRYGRRPYAVHDLEWAEKTKKDMLLIGDDYGKDGGMARNYGISFILYDPQNKATNLNGGTARFGHWHTLAKGVKSAGMAGLMKSVQPVAI